MSSTDPRDALTREAIRLLERYHHELIERFAICPWAKPARAAGRTRTHVVIDEPCRREDIAAVLDVWDADESVDVAFVIAPRFSLGQEAFSRWAARLAELLEDRFMSAPFYPEAVEAAVSTIHFFRQTPDPTIQLVRRTLLEEIRGQDPPHYANIFTLSLREIETDKPPRAAAASVIAHNERILESEGRAAIQEILDDILADRDRSYAPLLRLL